MYVLQTIYSGQKAVAAAGTAEPLLASAEDVWKLKIKAFKTNTDVVYIGGSSSMSADGYELQAGEELELKDLYQTGYEKVDLASIYVDAKVNGEGVSFIYVK